MCKKGHSSVAEPMLTYRSSQFNQEMVYDKNFWFAHWLAGTNIRDSTEEEGVDTHLFGTGGGGGSDVSDRGFLPLVHQKVRISSYSLSSHPHRITSGRKLPDAMHFGDWSQSAGEACACDRHNLGERVQYPSCILSGSFSSVVWRRDTERGRSTQLSLQPHAQPVISRPCQTGGWGILSQCH